jgi:hypothetical protein
MGNIREKVYNFKTKNKEGFVQSEIDTLLKDYPNINMDKFNIALLGVTCMIINDETVFYHCDIDMALRCGVVKSFYCGCEGFEKKHPLCNIIQCEGCAKAEGGGRLYVC